MYLPIGLLAELRVAGYKSFNVNDFVNDELQSICEKPIELLGTKKRVFFEYNLEKFLNEISYE